MKYRVLFEKRSRADGQQSALDPTLRLDEELDEDVVADKSFIEWLESGAHHSQEALDEDDAFLGLASSEVWEYTIFDDKRAEFENAIRRSGVVLESTVIGEPGTSEDDAGSEPLEEPPAVPSGLGDATESDDAVVGPTVDPTAGGAATRRGATDLQTGENTQGETGLEDLTVLDAGDPRLGLTHSEAPDADWAAGTGPARAKGRGIGTRDLTDRSSTLKRPGR